MRVLTGAGTSAAPSTGPGPPVRGRVRLSRLPARLRTLFCLRRYGAHLNRVLDKKVGEGAFPFFCAYRAGSPDLTGIDLDRFPGLLSCHSVRETQGQHQVHCYWLNRACYEAYRDAFLRALPGTTEELNGSVTHNRVKSKGVRERFPLWTVLITASAVIGAVAALWEQGARLVEAPDITVTFKRENRLNFEGSEKPVVAFTVTNQCRFASAEVRIQSALARNGSPPPPLADGARLSRIEPGKGADFDVEASSLKAAADPGPPEEYQVQLAITAKAGLWRRAQQFTFAAPPFRHWQAVGWTRPEPATLTGGNCYLRGILYSGHARKAAGIVTAAMPATVDSVVTTLAGESHLDSEASPSGEVRRQEFTTPDLQAFQEYPYTIKVSSAGMSREGCSELARASDLLRFR